MKLVFVAGPYRSDTEWGVHQNIQSAEAVSLELWLLGLAVICPHKNTAWFGGAAPDEIWLQGALEMVRRSDALLAAPNWEKSVGAKGEIGLAKELGLPIFYSVGEVREWVESRA